MGNPLYEAAFAQARLKVYRANRHIDEAQQLFTDYANSNFYDIVNYTDPKSGKQTIGIRTNPISLHVILAIGDAFHCLSSALEYVMSGLMKAKTGDAKRISFPTDESRKSFRNSFMKPNPERKIHLVEE